MNLARWIVPCLILSLQLEAGWLERKAEGWAWYEDAKQKPAEKEEKPIVSASEQIEQARKDLENLLAEALLEPTVENTKKYMEAQKTWMERSTAFANTWQKVIIANPQLDPTATTFATSQYGRQLQRMIEQEEKEQLIKSIAEEYGLFFFYEGESRISKAFALVINAFARKYGWAVLGITTDGTMLTEIPNSVANNGIASEMKISIFPALFAINPTKREAIPLAFGLKSVDQIEENIFAQFTNPMEEQ